MIETESDRLAMLSDFALDVVFDSQSGPAETIKGIFDNIYQEVEAGGNVGISMQQPRLFVRSSDVTGAVEGDTCEIDDVTYVIRVIMSDGNGMTELALEKQ
jgi:hypothetical protein